jgi:hypothetical protein
MTENFDEKQLDDQLASFTDLVLSEKHELNMQASSTTDELAELKKTVLRMKAAAIKARADNNANARIRSRLMVEWKKEQQAKRAADKGFNWNMPRLALAGGFVVLMLIGVATLLPTGNTPLTATAGGLRQWSPFLILAGILVIAIILWRNRRD